MKNILYIGPYREFSGMGNAARNYLKALATLDINLCIKPLYNIYKDYPEFDIDSEILDLESNVSKQYDTVIQHCYPHQFCYDHRFAKNIGITHLESYNYYNNITQYLELMDHIVVPSNTMARAIRSCGALDLLISVIPEPIDIENIRRYQENNIKIQRTNYSFYTIGDFIPRKNIELIILAFLLFSNENDNIDLVIKTKNYSNEHLQLDQTIEYEISKIYNMVKYKNMTNKPKFMVGETKYNNILYLHNNNDCFINVSSGESFGYSTLEAMAFNNNLIINENISSSEISANTPWLPVESKPTYCNSNEPNYYMYNTVDQKWYEPSLESIMHKMLLAIDESKENKIKRQESQSEKLQQYSMQTIADQFNQLI